MQPETVELLGNSFEDVKLARASTGKDEMTQIIFFYFLNNENLENNEQFWVASNDK